MPKFCDIRLVGEITYCDYMFLQEGHEYELTIRLSGAQLYSGFTNYHVASMQFWDGNGDLIKDDTVTEKHRVRFLGSESYHRADGWLFKKLTEVARG